MAQSRLFLSPHLPAPSAARESAPSLLAAPMADAIDPPIGARVRIYWTGEKRWFKGVVTKKQYEDGHSIHHVKYDDGDTKWHDLREEIWLLLGAPSSQAPAPCAVSAPKSASKPAKKPVPKPPPKPPPAPAPSPAPSAGSKQPRHTPEANGSAPKKVARSDPSPKSEKKFRKGEAQQPYHPLLQPLQSGRASQQSSAAASSSDAGAAPQLPPLVSFSPENVDVFPCGVIRVRGAVSAEARPRLWDTVMCAGFDYREVEADGAKGANMSYTHAAGAPDILLHYNYYEPPHAGQPPPMPLLCAADSVCRALAQLDVAQAVFGDGDSDDGSDEGDEDGGGAGGSDADAGGGGEAASDATAPAAASEGRDTTTSSPVIGAAPEAAPEAAPRADEGKPTANGAPKPANGSTKPPKTVWVDEAAADVAALVANAVKRAETENRQLLWPRRPNFRSVLAIGYKAADTFRWHTDLAGEDGWVCSISCGSTATFEYIPAAAPSAMRRARALSHGDEVVRIEVASGDCLLFHGGLLAHRIAAVDHDTGDEAMRRHCHMAPYLRLNLQVRVYGAGVDQGLQDLLARGYEYVQ